MSWLNITIYVFEEQLESHNHRELENLVNGIIYNAQLKH